jgi:hypothetical protein
VRAVTPHPSCRAEHWPASGHLQEFVVRSRKVPGGLWTEVTFIDPAEVTIEADMATVPMSITPQGTRVKVRLW